MTRPSVQLSLFAASVLFAACGDSAPSGDPVDVDVDSSDSGSGADAGSGVDAGDDVQADTEEDTDADAATDSGTDTATDANPDTATDAVADSAGDADPDAASCDNPGTPTLVTPETVESITSNFNVELLDCTRTAVELACELGTEHAYSERIEGTNRVITANGIPNHDVGDFPNPGNPNAISAQAYSYTVPVTPSGAGTTARIFGITTAGTVLDPGTAERWNDSDSWNYEALRYATAPNFFDTDDVNHPTALGVDCNFAHVQPGGSYHYHGVPTGLVPNEPRLAFVGWAGDGYPIFGRWGYSTPDDSGSAIVELRASYRLKTAARASGTAGPGGTPDGTFVQDWEYVAGLGDLDECNGRTGLVELNGELVSTYHYVLTNTYPYIPRCFHAAPSASFSAGGGGGGGGSLPECMPGQTRCCGDDVCDGPENATNCAADCG